MSNKDWLVFAMALPFCVALGFCIGIYAVLALAVQVYGAPIFFVIRRVTKRSNGTGGIYRL